MALATGSALARATCARSPGAQLVASLHSSHRSGELFLLRPPIAKRSIVMSVSVCVCVCLSAIVSSELHVRSSPNFLCVLPVAAASSVLLWRRGDTLRTSGFMDDVKFAHKTRLLDVAARQCTAALGLAINCAQ